MIGRALRAARVLNMEQRVAAAAALLLIVSTFGPFSFVEAGELLIAFGVLALLFARAEGMRFHLPFGDGTVIAAAGVWAGALIVARLLERPLGQNLLALGCAALLFLAGARERAKQPAGRRPAGGATRIPARFARTGRRGVPARPPRRMPRRSRSRRPSSSPTSRTRASSCISGRTSREDAQG